MAFEIPLINPEIGNEELEAVSRVLNSGQLSTGDSIKTFEHEFAKYIGVDHAITVNSGTSALELVLKASGYHKSDIICPSFTFMSVPNAILNTNRSPNFADIFPNTYTINYNTINIRNKTQAIIPVHTYGHPANMNEILEISEHHNLFVLEDCAESCGASINGKKVGSFGDAGIFSFHSTKNMTSCEGGMITTNNDKIAEDIRILRSHGNPNAPLKKPWVRNAIVPGHNYRMSNIHASIGVEQLKKLDKMNKKRQMNANYLSMKLNGNDNISTPYCIPGYQHVYQMYVIKIKNDSIKRDDFVCKLRDMGIEASVYFDPPCHQMELYQSHNCKLPVTEKISRSVVTLPMYPSLSNDQMNYIAESVVKLCQ